MMQVVFRGTHTLTVELPETVYVERLKESGRMGKRKYGYVVMEPPTVLTEEPGFEAVCTFNHLDALRICGDPPFTFAQAVVVSEVEEDDLYGVDQPYVRVLPETVRMVMAFPVELHPDRLVYQPAGIAPQEKDDLLLYFLSDSETLPDAMTAVADLDYLPSLEVSSFSRLHVVTVTDLEWKFRNEIAFIRTEHIVDHWVVPATVRFFDTHPALAGTFP